MVVFAPWHQAYERIKPDAFYVGVEGSIAWLLLNKSHENALLDLQLRRGYNFFFNGRDHLTPFAGIGFVEELGGKHHHFPDKLGIGYGGLGFLYDHEFNTIFNLGLRFKFLFGGSCATYASWGPSVLGTDVSLPITFRFGPKRHWDYRIEPFNLYVHGDQGSEGYWGFRNSLGYRF